MHQITKPSLEKAVKGNLIETCKRLGALALPNPATIYSKSGREDYTLLTAHGLTIYCEVKSPTGKLSPGQMKHREAVEHRGGVFFVYNGMNTPELIKLLCMEKPNVRCRSTTSVSIPKGEPRES